MAFPFGTIRFSRASWDIVRETVSRLEPIVSAISRWDGRTTTVQPPPAFRAQGAALRIPAYTLDPREAGTPAKIAAAAFGRVET